MGLAMKQALILALCLLSAPHGLTARIDYQHFAATVDASAPLPCGVEVPCAFNIALVGSSYAILGLEVYDRWKARTRLRSRSMTQRFGPFLRLPLGLTHPDA